MKHVVVHIGDAHFQSSHPRNADRLASLDQILDYGESLPNLAMWMWPGDIFHAKSSAQDRNDLAPRLQRMGDKAPVAICYGNHCYPGDLEVFARLTSKYPIKIASQPQTFTTRGATGIDLACFMLPWPSKAGLVSGGVEHDHLAEDARRHLDAIFLSAANDLSERGRNGTLTLMGGHASIGGATSSSGQPQIGLAAIELDPALLARFGPIYKGFNHIHAHQQIHEAVYAGSLCRLDFSELEPKGFIEIEFRREGDAWHHVWMFRPLSVPAMIHIEGKLTREGFQPDDPFLPDATGADVRVRYSYIRSELGALDLQCVKDTFSGARSLKLEPVPLLEHTIRAPEIAAAATLDEKVAVYASTHGIAVTEGLKAKLTALQSMAPEAILSQVAEHASRNGSVKSPTTPEGEKIRQMFDDLGLGR